MIPELTQDEMKALQAQAKAQKNPKSAEDFFYMVFTQHKSIYENLSSLIQDFTWDKKNKHGQQDRSKRQSYSMMQLPQKANINMLVIE